MLLAKSTYVIAFCPTSTLLACHAVLIGKKGHGFWEGGKGTRDKARMSRKDPRKYKRVGGGQARKT